MGRKAIHDWEGKAYQLEAILFRSREGMDKHELRAILHVDESGFTKIKKMLLRRLRNAGYTLNYKRDGRRVIYFISGDPNHIDIPNQFNVRHVKSRLENPLYRIEAILEKLDLDSPAYKHLDRVRTMVFRSIEDLEYLDDTMLAD